MSVADLLSLLRIPLGLLFLWSAGQRWIALVVLAIAGLTDVLDGWVARRLRRKAPARPRQANMGEWLDPVCDKVFALTLVVGLYRVASPPPLALLALLTREILQTAAFAVIRVVPRFRHLMQRYDFRAHAVGKATTVLQFVTGALLLFDHWAGPPAAYLAGALGLTSVGIYLRRLGRARPDEISQGESQKERQDEATAPPPIDRAARADVARASRS